jgi:enoyl-CoA hydratase/carnithine racemase
VSDRDPAPILLERHLLDGDTCAALLRLNRPDQLNPIDGETLVTLDHLLDELLADTRVRVILVTGAGRAFSAGGDLKAYITLQRDPVMFPKFLDDLHRVFGRLRAAPVPVVALVNGVTAAGGLELILNCDFAIAARSARIGDGHLNFGQMGGGGVLTLLPRAVGRARAAELIFSGRLLDSTEAADWGLVNRVVADDALEIEGLALARGIASKSRLALSNAKEILHAVWADNASVDSGLRIERERDAYYCLTSADAPEGLSAFAEKRPPRFTGR